MCGIVGAAGKITTAKEKQAIADLLTVCQFRGRDSTGVIGVSSLDEVEWTKQLGTPEYLIDTRRYNKVVGNVPKVIVGHCRHATAGKVSATNAHPFDFENVIGVHNGTLEYTWRRGTNSSGFDVDSEWLYSRINEVGVEDALNDIDKAGAWALTFWNKERKTLNFIRNKKRPLVFAWNEAKDIMFWASEAWMLHVVDRLVPLTVLDDEGSWYTELPPHTLWEFTVNRNGPKDKIFSMKPPREIEGGANFTQARQPPYQPAYSSVYSGANKGKGGSGVVHPFQRAGGNPAAVDSTEEELVDFLGSQSQSTSTKGPTDGRKEKPTSNSSETKSGKSSSKSSALLAGPKQGTKSSTGTLSLKDRNSASGRTTSRKNASSEQKPSSEEQSEGTSPSLKLVHSRPSPRRNPKGKEVSLRKVAGVWYLSRLSDSLEMPEAEFEENTGGVCSFCREPIGGLEEVHTILNRCSFICDDCGNIGD